jgi:hypothetical protein
MPCGFLPRPFSCEPNPTAWGDQDGEFILRALLQTELAAALPPGFEPLSGADIALTVFWQMRSYRSRPRPSWLESLWLTNPSIEMPIHGSPAEKSRELFLRVFRAALEGIIVTEGAPVQITATHLFRPHSGLELRITPD